MYAQGQSSSESGNFLKGGRPDGGKRTSMPYQIIVFYKLYFMYHIQCMYERIILTGKSANCDNYI